MDSMRLKVRITGEWFRLGGFHPHPQTRVQQHPPKFRTEAWGGGGLYLYVKERFVGWP